MNALSLLLTAATATAATLAAPALAAAQPVAQPAAQPIPRMTRPERAAPGTKDGTNATLAAIGVTVAGVGLMAAAAQVEDEGATVVLGTVGFGAALLGPSAGHLYAGEYRHSVATTAGRAASLAAMGMGVAMAFDCFDCEDSDHGGPLAAVLFYGGAGSLLALTAYDIWDAHRAAGRANARRTSLQIAPTALAAPRGPVAGLAIGGQF